MTHAHQFTSAIEWTGNRGSGTRTYRGYDRTWDICVPGRAVIHCSNDPLLGGDPTKMNPEDLLLSALSACHMLWFLHLAGDRGLTVTAYRDTPLGEAESDPSGKGRFLRAILRPEITLQAGDDPAVADAVHGEIGEVCFIARSVNFPVLHEARYFEA